MFSIWLARCSTTQNCNGQSSNQGNDGRTGIPLRLLTDGGPQFVGSLGTEFINLLQIVKVQTTANHPETNGCIEHKHSTLEGMWSKGKNEGLN